MMKTPSHLDRHLQLQLPIAHPHHHNMEEKAYKCPYQSCAFSTKHKYNLKRHEIVHTKEKKFPCTVCQYRAGTKVTLQKHMRGHEGTKPTSYPSSAPISHHHVQVPQLQQPQLPHSANHRHGSKVPSSSLPHHIHQQNPVARNPSDMDDRPFTCHMCNYKGKLKSHLTRHLSMKTHNNSRQHQQPEPPPPPQQQIQQQQLQHLQQLPIQIPQPQLQNLQNLQNEYKPVVPHTASSLTVQAGSFAGFSPTLFKVPYYYPYVNVGGKPYS